MEQLRLAHIKQLEDLDMKIRSAISPHKRWSSCVWPMSSSWRIWTWRSGQSLVHIKDGAAASDPHPTANHCRISRKTAISVVRVCFCWLAYKFACINRGDPHVLACWILRRVCIQDVIRIQIHLTKIEYLPVLETFFQNEFSITFFILKITGKLFAQDYLKG